MLDGEFPTLGAWVHYGLGSLNDNLPQFISMGNREYWNAKDGHYLGPEHDGVPIRVDPSNPLDYGPTCQKPDRQGAEGRFRPRRQAQQDACRRVPRRSGPEGPHQGVRTGLPHADVRAAGAEVRG